MLYWKVRQRQRAAPNTPPFDRNGDEMSLPHARKLLPLLLLSAIASSAHATPSSDPLHAWVGGDDPAKLEQWVNERLAAEQASLSKLLAVKGKRTLENTLQPFDEAENQLALAGNEAYLLFAVGKTAPLRDKAQALNQKIASVATDLSLNRQVYDAITATREELDGLPDDYIARHQAGADGKYTLNTDEPDRGPVNSFAKNADLRQRMYMAYYTRAYPANKQVLLDLLAARQQLAGLLGFKTYADLATADQMIGNAANVRKLLDDVDAASRDAKQKEYEQLLAFVKTREPATTAISAADASYWVEQYRREHYAFDAQSVRPYFPYDKVETGILDTASKIFHVHFKEVKDAPLWHPSVTVFDVLDDEKGGKKVGRIYLDMHPREGKDKWFSSAPVVPGIRGRQIPEGMLICNFSGGVASDPGLMQYDEVVTFFHEFGHLMHHILGSQNRWSQQGGFNVEGDFVEAPSQMLEEFFSSYSVLAPFAKHYQTGAVIPQDVVARINAAGAFGRGRWAQAQLFYSTLALNVHDRPVAEVDLDAQLRQLSDRFVPYTFIDGNRMYASFTHLTGYASNYYTYVLDKVIAIDFYARFNQEHPLDGPVSAQYRQRVINPGATKPAAQLVQDFLGRPQNMDAFKEWLGVEFKDTAK